MILDEGICTVFAVEDVSKPGEMPRKGYRKKSRAWYGVLDFATVASWPTEDREEIRVDERIRIPQNRSITNHDVVVLANVDEIQDGMRVLEVVRAYHGHDDESGEMITDLSLEVVGA